MGPFGLLEAQGEGSGASEAYDLRVVALFCCFFESTLFLGGGDGLSGARHCESTFFLGGGLPKRDYRVNLYWPPVRESVYVHAERHSSLAEGIE